MQITLLVVTAVITTAFPIALHVLDGSRRRSRQARC